MLNHGNNVGGVNQRRALAHVVRIRRASTGDVLADGPRATVPRAGAEESTFPRPPFKPSSPAIVVPSFGVGESNFDGAAMRQTASCSEDTAPHWSSMIGAFVSLDGFGANTVSTEESHATTQWPGTPQQRWLLDSEMAATGGGGDGAASWNTSPTGPCLSARCASVNWCQPALPVGAATSPCASIARPCLPPPPLLPSHVSRPLDLRLPTASAMIATRCSSLPFLPSVGSAFTELKSSPIAVPADNDSAAAGDMSQTDFSCLADEAEFVFDDDFTLAGSFEEVASCPYNDSGGSGDIIASSAGSPMICGASEQAVTGETGPMALEPHFGAASLFRGDVLLPDDQYITASSRTAQLAETPAAVSVATPAPYQRDIVWSLSDKLRQSTAELSQLNRGSVGEASVKREFRVPRVVTPYGAGTETRQPAAGCGSELSDQVGRHVLKIPTVRYGGQQTVLAGRGEDNQQRSVPPSAAAGGGAAEMKVPQRQYAVSVGESSSGGRQRFHSAPCRTRTCPAVCDSEMAPALRVRLGVAELGAALCSRSKKHTFWQAAGVAPSCCRALHTCYRYVETACVGVGGGGGGKFECVLCGRRFVFKSGVLRHHRMVHHQERRYECALCGALYFLLSDLKRHLLASHTDLQPFVCAQCGQQFNRTADLRKHSCQQRRPRRRLGRRSNSISW